MATTYTLTISPPTYGPVGSPVTVIVTPDGPFTGTITLTPSGAGLASGGAQVLTFAGTATQQGAVFVPTVPGRLTITGSNNGGLADPGPAGYTVAGGARLSTILTSIGTGLVTAGLFNANQVVYVLDDQPYPNSPSLGGQYVAIAPGAFRPVDGQVAGGGRYFTGLEGEIDVRVYALSMTDEPNVDSQRILKIVDLAHDVINVLQLFFPLTGIGTMLAEEPIRLASLGAPLKYKRAGEWIMISIPFSLTYQMALDTTVNV